MTKTIVLASGNSGKLREMQAILQPLGLQLVPQSRFKVTEAAETGRSFVENALIKARHACIATGLPAIADDSGLEVDALNGAPGIYSARYAGAVSDADAANNAKLLKELAGTPESQRGARFRCVIVFLRHPKDPEPLVCDGVWEGRILDAPVGDNGFGYDPLFYVPEQGCSSAQLPPEVKNRLSHRGQALRQLSEALQSC